MKRTHFLYILAIFFFASCQKFDLPRCEIINVIPDSLGVSVQARITDNGGIKYTADKGYCLSLYQIPSHEDPYSIQTSIPALDPEEEITDFSWRLEYLDEIAIKDTLYYLRAYVKNNAGMTYSNIVEISTKKKTESEEGKEGEENKEP